jgi:hypothetical protein
MSTIEQHCSYVPNECLCPACKLARRYLTAHFPSEEKEEIWREQQEANDGRLILCPQPN